VNDELETIVELVDQWLASNRSAHRQAEGGEAKPASSARAR